MEFTRENFDKLVRLKAAADEWSCDRYPEDAGDCDLMIAIIEVDGDRPEPLCAPDCEGGCGEPCDAYEVSEMRAALKNAAARFRREWAQRYGVRPSPIKPRNSGGNSD